jgi:hypothetical protein
MEALEQGAENKPLAFARLEYVEVPEAVAAAIREYEEAVAAATARKEAKRAAEQLQRESLEEVKRLETRSWTERLVADYLKAKA